MPVFSNDTDILKYEPILFAGLHFPWQVLCSGDDGVISGNTFSSARGGLMNSLVGAGGVIYLRSDDGVIDGGYEIVSVDSDTQLTISVVRADSGDGLIGIPSSSNVCYRVSTFRPQANEVGYELTEYFGIRPGNPGSRYGVEDIFDAEVLRRISVFAIVSSVYAMLASQAEDENFWKKSLYYQKLFDSGRERCRFYLDVDGDGGSDINVQAKCIRFCRE